MGVASTLISLREQITLIQQATRYSSLIAFSNKITIH